MEIGKNSFGSVFGIFNKLSIQQRMMLGGIVIVALVLLGFVIAIFNEPSMSTLYTNMSPEDASKVVEQLTAQKIQYSLDDGGATIKVPKDKVYDIRLTLAGKGIPSSGIVGYELFDKNTMGMSEFMQKLNYKRALEGELSRTIGQITGVEAAKVHIVFPEKTVFKDEQKEPTASVVLKMGSGVTLTNQNIVAISNLIASSCEGLNPAKVSVIDTKGRLLSREEEDNPLALASGKQYEIKGTVEAYLANKAQSLLDNVVGYGNSIVKVNVEIDFKQTEKTMESYDPDGQVAISEQSVKSESTGASSSDSNNVITENTTTNYEISKTIERVIDGAGNLKRITVAAVINGVPKTVGEGEEKQTVIEPRSNEELNKYQNLIAQVVGLDNTRNDQISIVSIPFETQSFEDENPQEVSPLDEVSKYANFLLIFVAIGASMFILKSLMKRLKNEKIMIGTMGGYSEHGFDDLSASPSGALSAGMSKPALNSTPKRRLLDVGDIEDEITDEAQQKKMRQDKIVNYVAKNPSEAAKLINSWLREDEF
ncbi:MAG: flagellar basal-body MS-ring/collar protein FliF [bacterium]